MTGGDLSRDPRLQVVGFVVRCRRRCHAATFARAFFGLLAAITPLVAAWFLSPGMAQDVPVVAATTLIAALLIAGVFAAIRRPNVRQVSEAIDRRLGLENRVATALEATGGDAFSVLVAKDAAGQLGRFEPRQVFPLEIWRHALTAAVVVVATAMLITAVEPRMDAPGRAGVTIPGQEGRSSSASTAAAHATGTEEQGQRVAGEPVPDRTSSAAETPNRVGALSDAAMSDEATGSAETNRDAADTARVDERPTPGVLVSQGESDISTSSAGMGSAARTAGGRADAVPEARNAATASTPGKGSRESAGSGPSGGVAGEAITSHITLPAPAPSIHPERPADATLATARAAADAALRRDDIGPSMRNLVRRYFLEVQRRNNP